MRFILLMSCVYGLALFTGCASMESHESPDSATSQESKPDAKDDLEDKRMERDKTMRELAIAKEKLEKVKLSGANQEADDADELAKAMAGLAIVETKLANLREVDAPVRLEASKVEIESHTNNLNEQREELAQLEMLYKESDLADKTREIVINRAKRRLALSERQLTVLNKQASMLANQTIPMETRELEKSQAEGRRDLEEQKRKARAHQFDGKIEVMSAESEIARLEAELSKLSSKIADLEKKQAKAEKK